MDWKLSTDFNPAAAYKARGKRFACFVAAKVAFLLSVASMAVLTLIAPLGGEAVFAACYSTAMFVVKVAGVVMPFLAFESLYWWYRLRMERRQGRVLPGQ